MKETPKRSRETKRENYEQNGRFVLEPGATDKRDGGRRGKGREEVRLAGWLVVLLRVSEQMRNARGRAGG